ncbi:MAG: hypothetical protein EBS20_08080 [Actinobacteria bacterium]|nr:hypothetical protein [Actinomycetota bacterium]
MGARTHLIGRCARAPPWHADPRIPRDRQRRHQRRSHSHCHRGDHRPVRNDDHHEPRTRLVHHDCEPMCARYLLLRRAHRPGVLRSVPHSCARCSMDPARRSSSRHDDQRRLISAEHPGTSRTEPACDTYRRINMTHERENDMGELRTGTDHLIGHIDGDVAVLSFNRPDRRNALSEEIYLGFATALEQVRDDADIRVLMVTGEGGAFCAGGDVKGFVADHADAGPRRSTEEAITHLTTIQKGVSLAFRSLPKPVVAALPGAAAGAGLSIALAADIRLAARSAVLVTAFSTIGASGDFGTSWFLPRLVGEAKAKELMWMSPRLDAAEAERLGIVNHVYDDATFADDAMAFCRALAARAPIAMRYIKENIQRGDDVPLAEALEGEAAAMVRTMATRDHREASLAFVEKRPPTFSGQ